MPATREKSNGQKIKTPGQILESLFESVEAYGGLKLELIKLKSLQSLTRVAASLVFQVIVYALIFLFVFILSIGIAFLLGEELGKPYHGFLIVAGFYLIAIVVFTMFFRTWIRRVVSNSIIKEVLE